MKRSFYRHEKGTVRRGAWEAVPYVSRSTDACKLTQYFMPFSKTSLNVSEYKPTVPSSTTDFDNEKDVEARHFNIETDPSYPEAFSSIITFAPEHNVVGVGFTIQQTLYRSIHDEPRFWFELSFPVEQVTHRMNFEEKVISTGGGAIDAIGLDGAPRVGTMTQAFKQSNWKYGKIDNCKRTAQGVADVTASINWATYFPCGFTASGVGFVAPTGTRIDAQNAAYLFSPVLGDNHHWQIIFFSQLSFNLVEHHEHKLKLYFNGRGSIIIRNQQVRSFDVYDKSWSRYMEVYSSQAQATAAQTAVDPNAGTSGINVFTACMTIDPRYQAETKSALMYEYKGLLAEFGGGLFVRHAELYEFDRWPRRLVFKDVNGDGNFNQARTIGKNYEGAAIDVVNEYSEAIQYLNDLDIDNATHPAIISATIYGTLGYKWYTSRAPVVLSVGSSYDFSQRNTTLHRWGVWGKLAVSF